MDVVPTRLLLNSSVGFTDKERKTFILTHYKWLEVILFYIRKMASSTIDSPRFFILICSYFIGGCLRVALGLP
jgi:hypothetical protein